MNEEVLNKINEARKAGKKIGLVQGSWDLFHLGHLRYILKARELCDYLIIAMDSDEKIKKRKGANRPIIPEAERYEFMKLLGLADAIIIKQVNEAKWQLIKTVKPDVLIAIKENYNEEQIKELEKICGKVAILPRQSESSTSDKIRKIMVSAKAANIKDLDGKVSLAIEEFKKRVGFSEKSPEPIGSLIKFMHDSTDWVSPVAACCYYNNEWHFGANHSDFNIPDNDIINRSELYYNEVEHAEINLLKKLGNVESLDTPIYTTLFPCDRCMKVLISKGVKEIYYLEDHPNRNWSKRSHELALKNGVKCINLTRPMEEKHESIPDYKYIYPPNARVQEQLDIMLNMEDLNQDPLDPKYIDQEILFQTPYWYVSKNRFPYEGALAQYLIAANYPIYDKEDITPEMWLDLQNIWHELTVNYNVAGGALCFRFGSHALSGASLKRVHLHVIEPKEEEKVKFTIGGKKELKPGLRLVRIKGDVNEK